MISRKINLTGSDFSFADGNSNSDELPMGKTQGSKKQGLIIHRLSINKSPSTVSSKFLPEKKREKKNDTVTATTPYTEKNKRKPTTR